MMRRMFLGVKLLGLLAIVGVLMMPDSAEAGRHHRRGCGHRGGWGGCYADSGCDVGPGCCGPQVSACGPNECAAECGGCAPSCCDGDSRTGMSMPRGPSMAERSDLQSQRNLRDGNRPTQNLPPAPAPGNPQQ